MKRAQKLEKTDFGLTTFFSYFFFMTLHFSLLIIYQAIFRWFSLFLGVVIVRTDHVQDKAETD